MVNSVWPDSWFGFKGFVAKSSIAKRRYGVCSPNWSTRNSLLWSITANAPFTINELPPAGSTVTPVRRSSDSMAFLMATAVCVPSNSSQGRMFTAIALSTPGAPTCWRLVLATFSVWVPSLPKSITEVPETILGSKSNPEPWRAMTMELASCSTLVVSVKSIFVFCKL